MKIPLIHLCILSVVILPLASGELDPFAKSGEKRQPREEDARVVTEQGRRTLEILRTKKIDSVKLVTGEFEEGFEIVKNRLAKHGVEVRILRGRKLDGDVLKHVRPAREPEGGYFLKMEDVTIGKFMKALDRWALTGWVLYPDGSITYFDHQCCGRLPRDELYCHDSQYEAGKPEVMKKAASGKGQAEQGGR